MKQPLSCFAFSNRIYKKRASVAGYPLKFKTNFGLANDDALGGFAEGGLHIQQINSCIQIA